MEIFLLSQYLCNKWKLWLAKKEYLPETSNSLTSLEKAQLSHIPEKEQL